MTDNRLAPAIATAAALTAACTKSPEQQTIADAAAALRGRDRILAMKTVTIEGEGTTANLGQDMTMESSGQQFAISGYKRVFDVQGGRSYTEQTRTANFAYFQGQQPQKQVFGLAGDSAYNVAPNGTATRASNAVVKDRTVEFYHHPPTVVRAALDAGTKLTNAHPAGRERVVDLETKGGLKFTLAIDSTSKLPSRVVSMADNTNLGDVAIETTFADYQDVSGVKLPTRLASKTDKYTTATLHVTKQSFDDFS